GFSNSEVMGKNPSFLKSESTKEHVYKELWATISQGKTWTGEMENRKKDGSLFWESVSISPITNTEGVITHYIAVKEDITHLKAMMENLIKAKEQAEASD
ncbi:PAS domain S-box protein, partial [Arthrospira platensis SPKY1]|nr:PAS domain S-box protein [Arthrospira platensis SPKY1]